MIAIREAIVRLGLRRQEFGDVLISTKGHLQQWLLDLRRVFMDRKTLLNIADEFWKQYGGRSEFQIAGMETAAIPLLTAILITAPADHININAFIIRKDRKTTGLGNSIEGAVTKAPIILLDDVINSGTSAEKARIVVESRSRQIDSVFAVVDYRSKKGLEWRRRHSITISSLFTLADFELTLKNDRPPLSQRYRAVWNTITPGGYAFHVVPKSAPLLVDNLIYRGSDVGKMQAFDAETGTVIWEFQVGGVSGKKGIWSSPAIHNGRIYFGAYNGTAYCLDAKSGREIWSQPYGEWIGASPLVIAKHGIVCLGIEYERPWAQGSIAALDLETGAKLWEHLTKKYQHGSPAYSESYDSIIWGTADHDMVCLDAKSGDVKWKFETRRSVKYAPAISEECGLVAFASFDKSIYILETASGKKRGEWLTGEICYTTPLFVGKLLFCGSGDRHLYVIDTGAMQLIKKIDLGARVYSSPTLIANRVVVGTNGGKMFEIDIATLALVGAVQLPDAITNAIVGNVDGSRIFVSTYMNHLYCLERIRSSINENVPSHASSARVDYSDSAAEVDSNLNTYFRCIARGVDTAAIVSEVQARPDMWAANTSRQNTVKVQRETQSIFLRSAARDAVSPSPIEDTQPSKTTDHARLYPETLCWVESFARQRNAVLGRVLLAKLNPNSQVYRHVDSGLYYQKRNRYHLVLISAGGSPMAAGDESVVMRENELWWFDNKAPHEAFNHSSEGRIHLIFDLEEPVGPPSRSARMDLPAAKTADLVS